MCLSLFIDHAFSYWPIYLSTLLCLAQLGDSMEAGLSLGRILWTQGRGREYLCPPLWLYSFSCAWGGFYFLSPWSPHPRTYVMEFSQLLSPQVMPCPERP